MTTQKLKFDIIDIDLVSGSLVVRYINPYGPIEQGKEPDKTKVKVARGDRKEQGEKVFTVDELESNNPNCDLILAVDIPTDAKGNYVTTEEKLIKQVANFFPHMEFDRWKQSTIATQQATKARLNRLNKIVGTKHEVEMVYPDPEVLE